MKINWFRFFVLLLMIAGLVYLPACGDDDSSPSNPPANNNPPANDNDDNEPALEKADLLGDWKAPGETAGDTTTTFSFTLEGNNEAKYKVATVVSNMGAAMVKPGTWDLAGTTLILVSPLAEMNGHGEVAGGIQVEINGRTFNKQ